MTPDVADTIDYEDVLAVAALAELEAEETEDKRTGADRRIVRRFRSD